jgi:thiamine pyrophosphokinase
VAAAKQNVPELVLIGALGGRLDQTLGNLSLLLLPELQELTVRLEDGDQEVFILHDSATIYGHQGDVVSLLPLWEDVNGVTTEELEYPLHNETLFRDRSRGISNVMQNNQAHIRIARGSLLCVHMFQNKYQEKK